ncbi:NAD(P)-binding protein [Annulohypoxylon maeteangense]|uniref:NAD(P)-binding protein n=1 Tax=Annulohypoxylon maeteangense TaxID=1927788 RepID=UPI002008A166|nr:NAD(P)-binding protein [Annulohypoxylon maeteangense]KAI0882238.1 NAD(P)-binding protein [Annulohypoxylon maeteangense]
MAPKIFLTGATGFIGGDALYSLVKAHPDYEFTLLVRNEERGKPVAAAYPKARLVYGSLDDTNIIEKEAAAADIVIHTADSADNEPSATAIAKGLAAGHTAEKPGYWIHLCGTGILTWYDTENKRYGQAPLPEQKYHDIDDIDRIVSLPDTAIHRNIDKIVLGANSPSVKALIVGPPTIYGQGRGPLNTRSIQVPSLIERTIQDGYAPIQAPGLTEWDNVHIHDLGDFFVLAVDAALDPSKNSNPEIFGPKAYFFLENGVHRWADVSRAIALETARQKLIPEPIAKEVDLPNFGTNSKSVAARARKYLGWTPKGPSLPDTLPATVTFEAKKLGKA